MNKSVISTLYKKELLDVLRDKKTVIMMLVLPLILYPLLFVGGTFLMSGVSKDMSTKEYKIGLDFEDEGDKYTYLLLEKCKRKDYKLVLYKSDDMDAALKAEAVDAYITREIKDGKEFYYINYMSAVNNSCYASDYLYDLFKEISNDMTVEKIEAAGLDSWDTLNPIIIKYADRSTGEETAGSLLGIIIPFMLIMSLLMGTMYPAIDTTAGERERGTLETVLTLPITNRELIMSKFLTVATIGTVSAFLNIISMAAVGTYMLNLTYKAAEKEVVVNMQRFIPAVIVGILCVFAFAIFISAISMCVCSFAKSYKEANNYITPLTLIVMMGSFVTFMPNVTLTRNVALIPVVNICLLIKELLAFKFSLDIILIVLLSNVAYGILSILFLGKIYNSEDVLFGDVSKTSQIFERRKNIKKGGVPSLGDMWFLIAVVAVLYIYLGGVLQLNYGLFGVALSQILVIAGIPLILSVYTKKNMRLTYRLKPCRILGFVGAIISILGAIIVGMGITGIVVQIFGVNAESAGVSNDILFENGLPVALLIAAVVPAICEELMFRGYIFSALSNRLKPNTAILITSIIFGAYHMNIVSLFTVSFIGAVICYVTYRTNCIYTGMLMHFINNAISVIFAYYPELTENFPDINILLGMIVGAALLILGIFTTKRVAK